MAEKFLKSENNINLQIQKSQHTSSMINSKRSTHHSQIVENQRENLESGKRK